MTTPELRSWQSVQEEALRRISNRQWKPGATIPSELELAQEFGCARVTVNRALRGLAEAGLLDRRRKAGTRVALLPVRKATLSIPIIRTEIEAKGFAYSYCLLARDFGAPPSEVKARLQAKPDSRFGLAEVDQYCAEILQVTNLDHLWTMYATRADAVSAVNA